MTVSFQNAFYPFTGSFIETNALMLLNICLHIHNKFYKNKTIEQIPMGNHIFTKHYLDTNGLCWKFVRLRLYFELKIRTQADNN